MFETRTHCLVIVIAVLLPQSHSLDQHPNPASSNTPLDNLRLEELAKTLAEASGLEDKCNETDPFSGSLGNALLNISQQATTTDKDEATTDKLVNSLTEKTAATASIENQQNELKSEEKADHETVDKDKTETVFVKDSESKLTTRESSDAYKVLEKRETDEIKRTQENNSSALQSNNALENNIKCENFQHEQADYQGSNISPVKGFVDDSDSSRMFRDVYDDASNTHSTVEKLQPEENSLFSKNQPSLTMKTKNRCSTCEDRMQKVVPDGGSFIELGSDHDEDDIIRKYQGMIFLIDNIIETAGGSSRKELGLCRKSKLADVSCLLTNDEDKMEKTVLQIVSCVKDAMKDQMTTKSCIPLPRELHSFLIWLMHGSEGGGMCPPTVQESKSKPSYLFHEDNHRPHIAGSVFINTPQCPSGSLLELISSNKALPNQIGKMIVAPVMPPVQPEQAQPILNMPPQYDVGNNNQNNNLNPQIIGEQQKVELPYQRKAPFTGRSYYRPLRSLQDESGRHPDVDYQRHEQANMAIRDPMEELMTYPEGSDPLYPNDSEYERKSRNVEYFPNAVPQTETDTSDREIGVKTITKRDISRRKNVGNKNREDRLETKSSPRKKKRRDGVMKFKKTSQDNYLDATSSTECLIDVQSLLQPNSWNEDKKVISKNKKEKRKDKKKTKDINRKDIQSKTVDNSGYSFKDEKVTNGDNKKEDSDSVKTSDSIENNSKTNEDENSSKDDQLDLELESESETKSSDSTKLKKKKRKNIKSFFKEKYNRLTTEVSVRGSTANMNFSDLIPCPDLPTSLPNKKSKICNHKDSCLGGKGFQVSFANRKSKHYRIKPSIIFEDELSRDTGIEAEEDDYPEPEYEMSNFNEADEYEMNYADDENDLDMYDDNELDTSRLKSDHIVNNKQVKKKNTENRLRSKKVGHTSKTHRNVKQKKKPKTDKTNAKSQLNTKHNPPRTENSQIVPHQEHSTSGSTANLDNNDKEGSKERALVVVTSTDSSGYESNGDNQSGLDKTPNEGIGQDNKEGLEDSLKEFSKAKYKLEQLEQMSNSEDTGSCKSDKENKSENILDESLTHLDTYNRQVADAQNAVSLENARGLSVSFVKSKLYSKQVAKNKSNIQDECRNTGPKKTDSKKKNSKKIDPYKVVSKVKKQPVTISMSKFSKTSRPRTVFGMKKSKVIRKQGTEDNKTISGTEIICKVQNYTSKEEDDENEEDDQDDSEDESYKDFEEDSLFEVKPKNQMWVDDERAMLDSEGLSNLEEASISEAANHRYPKNPVRTKNKTFYVTNDHKSPVKKDTNLSVINSPTTILNTRDCSKERQNSLLNVSDILKDVNMIHGDLNLDISTNTYELKGGKTTTKKICTSVTSTVTASTTTTTITACPSTTSSSVANTPIDTIDIDFTTAHPNFSQTKLITLDVNAMTLDMETETQRPSSPKFDQINSEDLKLQSDLVCFQNSLQKLFSK